MLFNNCQYNQFYFLNLDIYLSWWCLWPTTSFTKFL